MNKETSETVKQGPIEIFNKGDIVLIPSGTFVNELNIKQFRPPIELDTTSRIMYPGKYHTCVVLEEIVGNKQRKVLRGLHVNDKGEFLLFPIYFLPNESTILTHLPDATIKRIP